MGEINLASCLGSAALQLRQRPALTLVSQRGPSTVETFLNGFETPSFLLDPMMRIICNNAGAERLLTKKTDFVSRDGRLCTGSTASTDTLRKTIALVAEQGVPSWQMRQVRLQCSKKSDVFSLGLMRWVPGVDQAELAGIHVLMIAFESRRSLDPVERFGLTSAEVRVAQGLIAGLSPKAIAFQQGRSLNTIRTHVARMMVKTSTNRQFDLILTLTPKPDDYLS